MQITSMKKIATFILVLVGLFAKAQVIKNVDANAFSKYISEKKGVLIDLRTPDEITSKGLIKGAKQIDFLAKDSEKEIEKLDRKKTYLVYCAGGGRSADCAEMMQKLGFTEVINLEKGFGDWVRKGLEVEKKK